MEETPQLIEGKELVKLTQELAAEPGPELVFLLGAAFPIHRIGCQCKANSRWLGQKNDHLLPGIQKSLDQALPFSGYSRSWDPEEEHAHPRRREGQFPESWLELAVDIDTSRPMKPAFPEAQMNWREAEMLAYLRKHLQILKEARPAPLSPF
ncbi:Cap-Specific Mrna (Nucleoside-2'-O-)-Methyltransferase 2 [Manis pentadactyla]|nr:Cap-Specific Mrna (Nucleoside-2'-O-)-Methyltransferase 2 [Manis pentadactyla]